MKIAEIIAYLHNDWKYEVKVEKVFALLPTLSHFLVNGALFTLFLLGHNWSFVWSSQDEQIGSVWSPDRR